MGDKEEKEAPRSLDISAYSAGLDAEWRDSVENTISDCPYSPGSNAEKEFWRGYHAGEKHPARE